ncbi:hypothetical protein MASR2M78_35770 [Treponema sp.]
MTYCRLCGVSLKEGVEYCPLCKAKTVHEKPVTSEAGGVEYPGTGGSELNQNEFAEIQAGLSSAERNRIVVELLSVGFGVALIITLLADLFINHGFTWSRYSSVAIGIAWLFAAMPFILSGKPWILFAVLAPSLIFFVFLLDAFDNHLTWFLFLGLPIVLVGALCAAASIALIAVMHRKGLNVIGVALAVISGFCLGLEIILDLNLDQKISFDWSVVVALALVPTSGLLFYLHYRIVRRASLRKLFRL